MHRPVYFTFLLLICVLWTMCNSSSPNSSKESPSAKEIDWQGHRGARGLMPENSIPGFLKALEFPVKTLELDIVVSGDSQLVVSHEPWLSHHICSYPDGSAIAEEDEKKLNIFQMSYYDISAYDCGIIGNTRFPEQRKFRTKKPLLDNLIGSVEVYCEDHNLDKRNYNIELKSEEEGYGTFYPQPSAFVKLVLEKMKRFNIQDRVTLQSFDVNILNELKAQQCPYPISYLVANENSIDENLGKLDFLPEIYSPYHLLCDSNYISHCHDKGMKIIPWTINEVERMSELVTLGVDGIITDYPNLISQVKY